MIPKVHPCKLAAGLSQARALWGSQAEAWARLDKTPTAHPRHLNLPTTSQAYEQVNSPNYPSSPGLAQSLVPGYPVRSMASEKRGQA